MTRTRGARKAGAQAFAELYDKYRKHVHALCLRVFRADAEKAEDMVQEIFLQAHRKLHGSQGEPQFGLWLHRLAAHMVLADIRRSRRLHRWGEEVALDDEVDTGRAMHAPGEDGAARETLLEGARDPAALERALAGLDEDGRDLVLLHCFEDYSVEEIALMSGEPASVVESRARKAMLEFQRLLERRPQRVS